jgi:hypothetical protein
MPLDTVPARPRGATDRDGGVADVELRRVGELGGSQALGVGEFDDREVGDRVDAYDRGSVELALVRRDGDGRVGDRAVERDDVGVREHVAVRAEDDAGAGAAGLTARDVDRDDRRGCLCGDRGDDGRVRGVIHGHGRGRRVAADRGSGVARDGPDANAGA